MLTNGISRICLTSAALIGCGMTSSCRQGNNDEAPRPNIILILADDMGYSDLGCYGGEMSTPVLDSLAFAGLRYTQFYNCARSCPSRACLLTGLYPHQAGVGHMVTDRGMDGYHGTLVSQSVTLAEALRVCGYKTAMTGKWHVTNNTKPDGDRSQWPMQRGFDRFYGTLNGLGIFWDPTTLYDGETPIRAEGDYYYTEAISDAACGFIRELASKEDPFFLYVSYTAPHYPLHAREGYIEKYAGRFSAGWDSLRVERMKRMVGLGIFDEDTVLPERDAQCYPYDSEQYKEWQQMRMEVYAAMIEQMDVGVGKIMEEIRRVGISDNTLIVFLSDNGASSEGHLFNIVERTGGPWNIKQTHTRDGRPIRAGDFPGERLGPDDTYGSYGPQWAHLSNTPFKRYKSWVHEGGICAPMIVSWGDRIKDKGSFRRGVFSIIDFMPTFLELAGGTYPEKIRGQETIPMEGISMTRSFEEDYSDDDRILYWEHEGNRAIRQGRWKLVSEYPGAWSSLRPYPKGGNWELYDLEKDRTETEDLSASYPEVVERLSAEWTHWADRCGVRDWGEIGGVNW